MLHVRIKLFCSCLCVAFRTLVLVLEVMDYIANILISLPEDFVSFSINGPLLLHEILF